MKLKRKFWIILLLIGLLTPTGILLPRLFEAGEAWGEWDTAKVKKQIGYEPQGMKKNADIYKAPLPDYKIETGNSSVLSESVNYLLSAFAGIGIIFIITWLAIKYYQHHG